MGEEKGEGEGEIGGEGGGGVGREGREAVRKGMDRRPQMRELMKEGVIGEGKSAAEDTFTNCQYLKDIGGDLVDRLKEQF
jgi:hypothetical protein